VSISVSLTPSDNDGKFVSGSITISSTGVVDQENPDDCIHNGYQLVEFKELGYLGRGNSSVVKLAEHLPSGRKVAMKVINILDKSNRHQLLKEIRALYHADSPFLVDFLGAFYKDSAISIALEFMDAGSLEVHLPNAVCPDSLCLSMLPMLTTVSLCVCVYPPPQPSMYQSKHLVA
jgi:Protein kinase domain